MFIAAAVCTCAINRTVLYKIYIPMIHTSRTRGKRYLWKNYFSCFCQLLEIFLLVHHSAKFLQRINLGEHYGKAHCLP
jgi:hypothetical protein